MRHLDRFSIAIVGFALFYRSLYRYELVAALNGQRECPNSGGCELRSEVSHSPRGDILSEISFRILFGVARTVGARRTRIPCFEKGLTADTFACIRIYFLYNASTPSVSPESADRRPVRPSSCQPSDAELHPDRTDSLWSVLAGRSHILLDSSPHLANRIFKANGASPIIEE